MNTSIFATFCDPTTLHFNLLSSSSSLSSISYSHLLLLSAEPSSSTAYYYFLFLPLSYLITYSAFISLSICFYRFFPRFYYCLISFFHFYISFSSTFLFLRIDSPIPPSSLISSFYSSRPRTYSPPYAFEFLFTTPFFFSSYYCSISVFITSQYPLFFCFLLRRIFHCCLAASWNISPILCWIFVSAAVSVSRGHFRVGQTISETRTITLGVKIQI